MKALDLLVALCENDAEEWKFTHINENGSLNNLMLKGTWVGGYTLSHGTPKEGAMYLMVDIILEGCDKPDLIYQHKGETYEATMFGYRVDEILTDEELNGEA